MTITTIQTTKPLDQLLLDPNNFRFREHDNWRRVDEALIASAPAQRKAMSLVRGRGNDGIDDLLRSFRGNGWLEVDQVQVRPFADGRFVVVEGNRRITALKVMKEQHEVDGEPLGALNKDIFLNVPIVIQTQEDDRAQHLVHMGLVHISGKRHWSQYAKSLAIRELCETHKLSEDEVMARLSISKHEVRLSLRALHLCDAYRNSDWGDQFDGEKYTLLREAVRNQAVKSWLDWSDSSYSARDGRRQERFFALLSQVEREIDTSDDDEPVVVREEPALRTRDHVRRFGKLADSGDERALQNLEESRDLTAAELSSDALGRDRVRNALVLIDEQANQLFSQIGYVDDTQARGLQRSVKKLAGLWVGTGRSLQDILVSIEAAQPTQPMGVEAEAFAEPDFPPRGSGHLSSMTIARYRGLRDLKFDGLRRINIFAGLNNAGKTSVLESVRLLASLSEPASLLDILRRRGRMSELNSQWAADQLPEHVMISGSSHEPVAVKLHASKAHALQTAHPGYLNSFVIEAAIGSKQQRSTTHLYKGSPGRNTTRDGLGQLGPIVHSSPFSNQDPDVLAKLYDAAVASGLDRTVADLLRELLDEGIDSIKHTGGDPPRFRVARTSSPPPDGMDLGMYGDGLQRLFHIGLLFAHADGGFVLIDELENGVHAGLLAPLANMVHKFARRFNAQVFIATHSKECIDAFVSQENLAMSVRGFSMGFTEGRRDVEGVDGEELAKLVKLMNADLRTFQ